MIYDTCPIFYLTFMKILAQVKKKVSWIQRDFICEGVRGRIRWISLKVACEAKRLEG